MKISIITINYNDAKGLKRTIESVKSQIYKDFEHIIIDGDSCDGSKDIINENAELFSYWCSESDRGRYNAMNKGIAHASGDYLLFLNSGDYLSDDNVLKDFSMSLSNKDIVYGDLFYIVIIPLRFLLIIRMNSTLIILWSPHCHILLLLSNGVFLSALCIQSL